MKKSAIGQDPPSSTQLRHRPWNHNSSVPNGVKTPPLPLFPKLFPTTPFQIEVTAIMTNDTSARLFNIAWPPLAKYVFIDAHHPTPERDARGNFPSHPLFLFFERVAVSITSFRFGEKASRVCLSLEPRTGYPSRWVEEGRRSEGYFLLANLRMFLAPTNERK